MCPKSKLSKGILELDAFCTFELFCLHSVFRKENVLLKRAKGYNGQRPPSDACAQTLTITKQHRRKAGTCDCTPLHLSLIYCLLYIRCSFTGSDLQQSLCETSACTDSAETLRDKRQMHNKLSATFLFCSGISTF